MHAQNATAYVPNFVRGGMEQTPPEARRRKFENPLYHRGSIGNEGTESLRR